MPDERDAVCGGTLEQAASSETTATGTQIRSMKDGTGAARPDSYDNG
jgi:hypothetical protein